MRYLFLILLAVCLISCKPSLPKIVNVGPSDLPNASETPASTPAAADVTWKIGVVTQQPDGVLCLQTNNPGLTPDAPVSIIASPYKIPQKVFSATVKNRLEKSCIFKEPDLEGKSTRSYYALQLQGAKADAADEIGVAIAVLDTPVPVQVTRGMATVDLDGDGNVEYFRQCASHEGLHLTVWTGKPTNGKIIWHNYHHLEYGVDPTCTKKESEGFDE